MAEWLIPSRRRRRPADLTYAADERPPLVAILTLAVQHAVMALALTAYAIIAARHAGLDGDATRTLVAMTVIAMAVATLLQARGGLLGAGALIVHMPDPFYISIAAGVLKAAGPAGLVALGVPSGLVQIGFARVLDRLRALFPPPVTGVVVLVAGLSLVEYAFANALGVARTEVVEIDDVAIFLATLGTMAGLSIWGSRPLKLLGLVAGLVAGVLVAAALGELTGLDAIAAAPMFDIPDWRVPELAASPATALSIAVIAVLVSIDSLACVAMMDKMDDAAWRRTDMRMVAGGVTANGFGDLTSGLLGGMPVAPSSANIGLAHASRSTSRVIGVAAAAIFALVALSPKAVVTLTLVPTPVMGAIGLYAAAFLITSGVELIASRALDTRAVFMVGISVSLAVVSLGYQYLVASIPAPFHALFDDAIVVAGVSAVVLNLVFRLGLTRRARLDGEALAEPGALVAFLDASAARWGARTDVARRATSAAIVAAEEVAAAGRRVAAIEATFDELSLDVAVVHDGPPLAASLASPAAAAPGPQVLEGDDASLDAAVAQGRRLVVAQLADRVIAQPCEGGSRLLLHFEH
jgi:xanthine permease XanP